MTALVLQFPPRRPPPPEPRPMVFLECPEPIAAWAGVGR
jgi:hypothetical protein